MALKAAPLRLGYDAPPEKGSPLDKLAKLRGEAPMQTAREFPPGHPIGAVCNDVEVGDLIVICDVCRLLRSGARAHGVTLDWPKGDDCTECLRTTGGVCAKHSGPEPREY